MIDLDDYAAELRRKGSVLLPPYSVFDAEEVELLDSLQSTLPEEKVTHGDAGDIHDVYCRRIQTDGPGELPTRVNGRASDRIMELLEDGRRRELFRRLFDSEELAFIRRCQVNRMVQGSFVGLHLDAAANPDYEFSVILQLGREFSGAQFVIHMDDGGREVFDPPHGSVLVTTCKIKHEVTRLCSNERSALVYFYSRNGGHNRRCPSTLPSVARAGYG